MLYMCMNQWAVLASARLPVVGVHSNRETPWPSSLLPLVVEWSRLPGSVGSDSTRGSTETVGPFQCIQASWSYQMSRLSPLRQQHGKKAK